MPAGDALSDLAFRTLRSCLVVLQLKYLDLFSNSLTGTLPSKWSTMKQVSQPCSCTTHVAQGGQDAYSNTVLWTLVSTCDVLDMWIFRHCIVYNRNACKVLKVSLCCS